MNSMKERLRKQVTALLVEREIFDMDRWFSASLPSSDDRIRHYPAIYQLQRFNTNYSDTHYVN